MISRARRSITVADETGTQKLGGIVARLAQRCDVIALTGTLGAGKTVFARGFISALAGEAEVPSPTFTLVQLYEAAPATIYHFDLYRLERPEDAFELGIEDAFADGIALIEWPDRLGAYLPSERLDVSLRPGARETDRDIAFDAAGSWALRLEQADLHV